MIAPGACTACGATLPERGTCWHLSAGATTGASAGLSESFSVCTWCVEQMRIRGAVARAAARRAKTPNQNTERYQRAKLRQPEWMQRRQIERVQR